MDSFPRFFAPTFIPDSFAPAVGPFHPPIRTREFRISVLESHADDTIRGRKSHRIRVSVTRKKRIPGKRKSDSETSEVSVEPSGRI